MRFLLRLLANAAALAVATWLLAGIQLTAAGTGDKVLVLLVVALIFGVVNAVVKPVFTAVSACIVLLTLGLFLLVINAIILYLADYLLTGFDISGIITAILFSLVLSIVTAIIDAIL